MDCATFTIQLLNALAWPLVVVFVIDTFQKSISNLIENLSNLKFKWNNLEGDLIRREVEKINEQVDKAIPPAPLAEQAASPNAYEPETENYRQLIDISPTAGIIAAWQDVETAMRALGAKHSMGPTRSGPEQTPFAKALLNEGAISAVTFDLLDQLRKVRNEVTHRRVEIDRSVALQYADITTRVLAQLEKKK